MRKAAEAMIRVIVVAKKVDNSRLQGSAFVRYFLALGPLTGSQAPCQGHFCLPVGRPPRRLISKLCDDVVRKASIAPIKEESRRGANYLADINFFGRQVSTRYRC